MYSNGLKVAEGLSLCHIRTWIGCKKSAIFAWIQRVVKYVEVSFTLSLARRDFTLMNCYTQLSITFRRAHLIVNSFTTPKLQQHVSDHFHVIWWILNWGSFFFNLIWSFREIPALPLWQSQNEHENVRYSRAATIQSTKCANKCSYYAWNKRLVDTIRCKYRFFFHQIWLAKNMKKMISFVVNLECSTVGQFIGTLSGCNQQTKWLQSHRWAAC